ncbi:MFS transporter [Sphaerisporangium krabiense]|uniref:MFS family permease n=1 Tax=Sphaerisporangium krabiense TaxID=763782 RepID=A0A7W8ZAU3_9ACTN|nr:MFS transporter [Sphaerisporangium krabiense]MBB5630588.1 MFS family permease [Sphaerisporangium krabiense]GII62456.1 MFS transporter [Sphaerisporangium krabiense]
MARKSLGKWARGRLAALAYRDLRLFFAGEATSLLGSSMAALAVTFAVLDTGGTQTELGVIMAARIVPMVALLPLGGVVADRVGPRRVMIAADVLRGASQAVLAAALFLGRPSIWTFVAAAVVWGTGEAFAMPARGGLIPRLADSGTPYEGKLRDANALSGLAQSLANVGGPVLAGAVMAGAGASVVVALDAATYAAGAVALAKLRVSDAPVPSSGGEKGAMRQGWDHFRARTWLWVTTVQFTLFNVLVWAPFLVLGPVVAHERLGGAQGWGLIMSLYGAGAMAGGLAMVGGRVPRRPLVVATVATFGWALPSGALAAGLSTPVVAVAALVAGAGSAVCGALYATTNQQHVPPEVLARITSLTGVGAFALGPVGLAAAGPVAAVAGVTTVLCFGAVWQLVAGAAVLAVPDVRRLTTPARVAGTPAAAPVE